MTNTHIEHRTVKLDKVRQNNIVLVDLSEHQSDSVFRQEYTRASKIIRKLIAESDRLSEKNQNDSTRDRKHHTFNFAEYQSAVPFIGDRGTGKTSVMCSILERLGSYGQSCHDSTAAFYLGPENAAARFITFDMIDANTLKNTEDVMEIILSRMLSYLEDIQDAPDFRELYRQIDELYTALGLVYRKEACNQSEFGLTGLQQIADSQKAIASFRKLITQFTNTIGKYKFGNHPCYLVIALDDIDMYQGASSGMQDSPFALLEQIYNFMRAPGLIVLMTYNEHILKRKCNSHFERIYFSSSELKYCTLTEKTDIETLTGQFMSKLFPQEQRIYLPNYMYIDSANQSNLYVKPILNDLNSTEPIIINPFNADEIIRVKEFMLRLIAYKTGVFFDAAGTKKHFFEPRNLREFGELFQVIYSLEEIPKEPNEQEGVKSRNRQELLNYLYNQFALKHLSTDENKMFHSLAMLPLHRQDRTLVDNIRQQRMNIASNQPDTFGYLPKFGRERWRYSYGELLHNLFYATRIAKTNGSEETYFSKEFLHCIFGTHSTIMNQVIRMPNSRSTMMSILGSSVSGRWANEMLPAFSYARTKKPIAAGSLSLPIRCFFGWEIPEDVQHALLSLQDGSRNNENIVSLFVEALVVAGMFFTGFPRKGLKIALDAKSNEYGEVNLALHSLSEDQICFNVMNFVINLYNALPDAGSENEGYLSYIYEKLNSLGDLLVYQLTRDWDQEKRKAEWIKNIMTEQAQKSKDPMDIDETQRRLNASQLADQNVNAWATLVTSINFDHIAFKKEWTSILKKVIISFQQEIKKWENSHDESALALPVQNFDMMYNILKRLSSVSYHDIPEEALVDEVFDYYIGLYQSIEDELAKQDNIYFNGNSNGFAQAFRDSVFYRIIFAKKDSTKYNPYIRHVLNLMIHAAMSSQDARNRATP